jgi:hypothetical protein
VRRIALPSGDAQRRGAVSWFVLTHCVTFFVDLVVGTRPGNRDKDLQIRVLRLLQRDRPRPPRLTRGEQLTLAALAAALVRATDGSRHQLDHYLLLFKPDTILKWHREMVRRRWTCRRTQPGGRPTITAEVEALILGLARENARWGHRRLQGELSKIGHAISAAVMRTPFRSPTANAYAERWGGSVRRECLDHFLIVNEAHLRHGLAAYFANDNRARLHQGLRQQTPVPFAPCAHGRSVRRRDVLGGLIHECDCDAS